MEEVIGSIPIRSTNKSNNLAVLTVQSGPGTIRCSVPMPATTLALTLPVNKVDAHLATITVIGVGPLDM